MTIYFNFYFSYTCNKKQDGLPDYFYFNPNHNRENNFGVFKSWYRQNRGAYKGFKIVGTSEKIQ